MTIRSSRSTQRYTNRERVDKEQDSRNNVSCHKGERTIDFRRAYFQPKMGPVMWRDEISGGVPVTESSMNKSSSYPFLQSAIKRTKVSSQQVVVVSRIRSLFLKCRPSPDRRLFVVQLPQHTNVTFNLDDPG